MKRVTLVNPGDNLKRRILVLCYREALKLATRYNLGRWGFMSKGHRFASNFLGLKTKVATLHGQKMFLDSRDTHNLSIAGTWDPHTTRLLPSWISPGDTVLDIGAHIGYYTLLFAKLVGERGKVYAFEPEPSNFKLLQKNVEANSYENVVLEPKAVSSQKGKLPLYVDNIGSGGHSLEDFSEGRSSLEVEVLRLDEYPLTRVDFIKMDIEGHESKALDGMSNLLRTNPQVKILTEVLPSAIEQSGSCVESYLRQLRNLGFQLSCIDERKKKLEPLRGSWKFHRDRAVNVLCSR